MATLNVADKETLDLTYEAVLKSNENLGLLNSTIGTDNPVSLDTMLTQLLYGTTFEYSTAGTYNLLIPANVSKIKVTACGGGGGGAYAVGSANNPVSGGGGGGGADAVIDAEYSVTPQTTLSITIGVGGTAGKSDSPNGGNGGATIIGNAVTIAGGNGAVVGSEQSTSGFNTSYGAANGNGGKGGRAYVNDDTSTTVLAEDGSNGILGTGGIGGTADFKNRNILGVGGGGGGGSIGAGGKGATTSGKASNSGTAAGDGTKGGGGGGGSLFGGHTTSSAYRGAPGSGGDGYAKITLIVDMEV